MHQESKKGSILENISKFVTRLFSENLPTWAVYHDLQHTIETVDGCVEIGKGSGITNEDLEILCIAAWFHDTGYMFNVEEHEEKSSEIALIFLKENSYPLDRINRVRDFIIATKISITPQNLLESIICDADLISLGRPDYFEKNDLLKLEIERRENKKINELAWLKRSLNFLSSHNYFTEYARLNLGSQLKSNLIILRENIDKYYQ